MGGLCSQKTQNPSSLEPPKAKKQGSIENNIISVPKVTYSNIQNGINYNSNDDQSKADKLESNGKLTLEEN